MTTPRRTAATPFIWTEDRPGGERAPADVAEARRHLREMNRRRRRMRWRWFGPRHLRVVLVMTFLRPVITALLVRRRIRRTGATVREETGIPLWKQWFQIMHDVLRWGLTPSEFYRYRLYEPERRELAGLYVPDHEIAEVHAGLFGWDGVPWDKIEFDRRCREAGLPVIPILATCPPHGDPVVHDPDSPLWEGDLYTKHALGGTGSSQRWWRRTPDGGYTDGTRAFASREALLRHLCDAPIRLESIFARGLQTEIVQPFVPNHPVVDQVSSGALATVRISGIALSGGRPARMLEAALKMPVGDAVVDNWSKGNLGSVVDLATGRLGPALKQCEDGIVRPVPEHPDTGHPVEGLRLPDWERTLELCVKGHELFPEAPSLGWDVGLTPDGPVLVEANLMWGAVQGPMNRPLGLTPFPRWTVEWLEEREAEEGGP